MAYMSDNIVQVADGSVVVFDKDTKEAYVLQPHSISVIDSDQAAAAAKVLVENGKGIRLTKLQLEALVNGLVHMALA
jgi:DNA-binding beta-propeller fold protein YncE